MPRTVTIRSLPQAFVVIQEMQGQERERGEGYRAGGRAALPAYDREQIPLKKSV